MGQVTDAIECARCGKVHAACAAHARSGEPCKREPSPWQRVCALHGGASPRALQAAAKREAAAILVQTYDADHEAILAAQGLEPIRDPLEALGRVAAASEHLLDALGSRVNALPDIINVDAKGTEEISAIFRAYERAMDRHARFADLLVRAGYEDRRVRIEEATATAFSTVLTAVLARLQLTHEQRALVATVVPEELRAIQGG